MSLGSRLRFVSPLALVASLLASSGAFSQTAPAGGGVKATPTASATAPRPRREPGRDRERPAAGHRSDHGAGGFGRRSSASAADLPGASASHSAAAEGLRAPAEGSARLRGERQRVPAPAHDDRAPALREPAQAGADVARQGNRDREAGPGHGPQRSDPAPRRLRGALQRAAIRPERHSRTRCSGSRRSTKSGLASLRTATSRTGLEPAIALYRRLIREYPRYEEVAAVHYYLGHCV